MRSGILVLGVLPAILLSLSEHFRAHPPYKGLSSARSNSSTSSHGGTSARH